MESARLVRRSLVSAFVVVHITATLLFVIPTCPLRVNCYKVVSLYILPLGLWQYWGMFSPDPPANILMLDATVTDVRGMRHNFEFPRQADSSIWRAMPRFRHSKFVMNLSDPDPGMELNRRCAARHVVRQLAMPAEAFPVDVQLIFTAIPCPPAGSTLAETPSQKQFFPVGTYRFASRDEVLP